jgi:DNA polymerase-3 subunit alpha
LTDKPFVHLHVHSEYSLLDGANKCPDLAKATKDMGMNACALTDHGVMYGCVDFYNECNSAGVKPILGCEVYVDPNGYMCRDGKNQYHLILLSENNEGYHNLMKIVSIANTDGFYYKPRIDHEVLSKYSKGIIASSACLGGEVPNLIVRGDIDGAKKCAGLYRDIFGKDNFFLEIQHNSIPEQAIVNKELIKLAREENYPLIATNDSHYMNRSDASWHDVLLCIQTNNLVDNPNRYKFTGDDFYFRSPEEMWNIFGAEVPESLTNTQVIADRCNVTLEMGHYYLPEFPLPEGETLASHLRGLAERGLKKRLKTDDPPEKYVSRLNYELGIIEQMDFPGYFCIVSDIINAAKARGIPIGPGRGSAAGSVVAWSLGITDLDPIRYNLLFERFLNPERISMPDIDTDVSDKGRDELIAYIVEKYGKDRVAQIITFDRMMSRAAITDVGRALGMPIPDVRRVAKLIPNSIKSGIKSIPDALEKVPDLKSLYESDDKVKRLLDIAKHVEGIARHCGQHAAGIVITPKPLVEMVPLRKFGDNQIVIQYSMSPVEKLGLVKMDFLGLKTLSMIEGALANIETSRKQKIDLNDIPMDDAATYEMLQRGDTLGVFQLESAGMTALVRRMVPDCFEDLIALVALYRPGPLESGMADQYVKRKHKEEVVHYLHPCLESYMKETYGVILYQEQVMQSASALAGYTLGEADLLRRAMGKKKKAVMAEQRDKFINGAQKNSVDPQKAGEIFDIIEKFAGYGFNKSHSAAYALISYRTAWLKAHYGPEFLASYLTSIVGSKMEVLGQYIRSVRDAGYPVLPPDINESREDFTVVGNVIRLGLSAIAKAGKTAVASIVKTRDENGNFKSVWDFCRKIDSRAVNKGVVENLVKAGAFDSLESNRAKVLAAIPEFMDIASKHSVDTNQSSLFVEVDDADLEPEMREVEDFSLREKLNYEKESTGLYISGHPFDKYQPQVKNYITCSLTNLPLWQASQEPVITAGLLSGIKERFTKKGDAMGIAEIEDAESKTEVVIFPRTWAKYKPMLIIGELYLVKGQPREDRGMSILAEEIFTEENYKDSITPHVIITINSETVDEKFYGGFLNVLKHNTGRHNVILRVNTPDQSIVSLLQQKVEPGEKLTKELNVFAGDCISCE